MTDKNQKDKPVERKRIPLGTRNRLNAPKRAGFVRRFVNDVGDRVQRFKEAGYNIVEGDVPTGDSKIGRASQLGSTVAAEVGGGKKAVLMEIKEEWYNEDYNTAQAKIDRVENEMKRVPGQTSQDGLSGEVRKP